MVKVEENRAMTGKNYDVTKDHILCLCRYVGVNYTDKTFKNFKGFLEAYVDMRCVIAQLSVIVDDMELKYEAPKLFDSMIAGEVIPKEIIEGYLIRLAKSGQLFELTNLSMEKVRSFRTEGKLFAEILSHLYFDEKPLRDKDLERNLHLSHATYYRKKKNAIMLFGVYFWGLILEHWSDSVNEMRSMEQSHGRSGVLADIREKEIENRKREAI